LSTLVRPSLLVVVLINAILYYSIHNYIQQTKSWKIVGKSRCTKGLSKVGGKLSDKVGQIDLTQFEEIFIEDKSGTEMSDRDLKI
ncbi:hypothetical protein, partial [Streptococcus sp. 2741]|uniref:hypothetical protein n=1 Tax=Streptococcus sp. 2741 TaxID=2582691 RepID=UPI0019653C31